MSLWPDAMASRAGRKTGVGACIFGRCKGYFSQISLNMPEKILCDKVSLYKFSVPVGTIYFPPSFHIVENRKFDLEIWF